LPRRRETRFDAVRPDRRQKHRADAPKARPTGASAKSEISRLERAPQARLEHVCVVGAGVIGSLFAGHLGRVADVSVLCRRAEHARDLNEHGLRISGKADFVTRVSAACSVAELPSPDLVIVATKAGGLDAAAASLAGHWPDAAVMPVLNGLGAEDVLRRAGEWPLISAVTFISGTKHSDTHVHYILDTETWLGPWAGTPFGLVQEAGDLIARSGLKVEVLPDLRPAQWSKLIFNATVNGVAALTGLPHDFHFAQEDAPGALGRIVHALVDEGKAVARAARIELHDDPWEMNVLATRRGSAHFPSMLEDVEAGRATEVDLINGALVREARGHGVETPLQEAVLALVRGRESAYACPDRT
jgi:2-dehydropantoate 2-reductase